MTPSSLQWSYGRSHGVPSATKRSLYSCGGLASLLQSKFPEHGGLVWNQGESSSTPMLIQAIEPCKKLGECPNYVKCGTEHLACKAFLDYVNTSEETQRADVEGYSLVDARDPTRAYYLACDLPKPRGRPKGSKTKITKRRSKRTGRKKCTGCHAYKPRYQFPVSKKTGARSKTCRHCQDRNRRLRNERV